MSRRMNGFTIIELLVVISIIALLISILLPSLAGARDRARFVKWAGYSHSLRTDTSMAFYFNLEQQDGTETDSNGDFEVWNRAAGDPFKMGKYTLEPENMNATLGNLGSPTTTFHDFRTSPGTIPEWHTTSGFDGRWKGKGAMTFTATDDEVVYFENNELLDQLRGEHTIAMWFNPAADLNTSNVLRIFEYSDRIFMLGDPGGGAMNYGLKENTTGTFVSGNPNYDGGQWHFVVGTYDGDRTMTAYTNAKQTDQLTTFNPPIQEQFFVSDPGVFWGCDDRGYGFDGSIDEVAMFDRRMNVEQIEEMYRVGKTRRKD